MFKTYVIFSKGYSMKRSIEKTYDRLAVGERLRKKRNYLGLTQSEIAERIDRATKYYADIERGACGMSIETLMDISEILNLSLDEIIYGINSDVTPKEADIENIIVMLKKLEPKKMDYAIKLLSIFINACEHQDTAQ